MKIWLADLTYTQQTVASDTIPAAVGGIATYARTHLPPGTELRVFKFPEDLAKAFESENPDVIGFSNYMWNFRLSYALAEVIKRKHPDTMTVFGGPNFPTVAVEQEAMLRAHPAIDYHVMKEGEIAFLKLVQAWMQTGGDKALMPGDLPNVAFVRPDGTFQTTTRVERIMDLAQIPSPYLSGDLDQFFDGRLLPIIQTNRGCPFTCTFCTEGQSYWTKVYYKPEELIRQELTVIGQKMRQLPPERHRSDLLIADSNFGMYRGDLTTCRVIADIQAQYDYPKYINVATGKNNKERVLEAAKLVNGAMKLAGSVQSLDPLVMTNIKRANISGSQLLEMAMRSSEIGANTYSEVILALPGDSKEAHFRTLSTLIDGEFNTVCMYQLMILPGTEMGTLDVQRRFEMRLRYRVVPRCFGYYDFLGEKVAVAEVEEICIQNNSLPFEDYLECRRMNLIINIFYNEGIFAELLKLLRMNSISPWKWLTRIFETSYASGFDALQREFIEETKGELWHDKEALVRSTKDPAVIDHYISGELGSNLMFKYKALSLTTQLDAVAEVARQSFADVLREHGKTEWRGLADEVIQYNFLRVADIFHPAAAEKRGTFSYDIAAFGAHHGTSTVDEFGLPRPAEVTFRHSQEQREQLASYVGIFGNDTRGLTRILSRIYLKKFFRNLAVNQADPALGPVTYVQTIMGS